jgi:tRNA(fMet)-specific endonuclease VapC
MNAVVLDTDVFSFFFKGDTRAAAYAQDIKDRQTCLCFQSIAEVKSWALLRNWGQSRRERLERVLAHYLVLPYDSEMAEMWAQVTATRQGLGRRIESGDAWIAAAALRHDIPLLTHNAADSTT